MSLDSDHPGDDYVHFNTSSPTACSDACDNDPNRCIAFVYVKPGYQSPSAICYLKSAPLLPPGDVNDCCISGYVKSLRELDVITRTIKLPINATDPVISVHVSATTGVVRSLSSFDDWYSFLPTMDPQFVFSQSIKHEPSAFVPHWQFKVVFSLLSSNVPVTCDYY